MPILFQKIPKIHNMCGDIFNFFYKQIFPCFELCQGTQSLSSNGPTEDVDDPGTAKWGSWVLWIVEFSRCCACSALGAQGSLPWLVLHFFDLVWNAQPCPAPLPVFLQQPGGASSRWNLGIPGSASWTGGRCLRGVRNALINSSGPLPAK